MSKKEFNLERVNFSAPENLKDIESFLKNDGEPGTFCGFNCLNDFYTHKGSGCTDWTGFPSSGKTYFLLEILFNLSEHHGLRHALYVPDIGSFKDVLSKLIKMHIGRDFSNKYNNIVTMEEIYHKLPWLNHHFVVLKRSDIKKPVSPVNFWEFVCDYKDAEGGLQTGMIDSWKNMYHDLSGKREDQYLDYTLSYRNELAEQYKKHFHTIAHSLKTEHEESTNGGKKKRRIPDANDIKGGGSWFANGKNIITVDYPDKTDTCVDLYISKTKPEDVGRTGSVIGKLFLDRVKGRYYEVISGTHIYGHKSMSPQQSNLNFAPINYSSPLNDQDVPF